MYCPISAKHGVVAALWLFVSCVQAGTVQAPQDATGFRAHNGNQVGAAAPPATAQETEPAASAPPNGATSVDAAPPAADAISGGETWCRPAITVTYLVDDDTKRQLQSALPDVPAIARSAIADICRLYFAKASDVPPGREALEIVFDDKTSGGYQLGGQVVTGAGTSLADTPEKNIFNFSGLMRHEIGHFYQENTVGAPSWLIEGMADFVPNSTGWAKSVRSKDGSYTDGYGVTAYFFIYLDTAHPNFIKNLEKALHEPSSAWNGSFFAAQTDKSVDELWNAYQASF